MVRTSEKTGQRALRMRDRQRILHNLVALIGLGKAAVIGAGVVLALVGYADLAEHVLSRELLAAIGSGLRLEAAAGIGGLIGVIVGLATSLFR